MVLIFVQKGLKVLLKLSTRIKLKWNHNGEIAWSVNHWGATRQLMGNSIVGNPGKTFFRPKYSGVFDPKEKRKDWLAFSSRIHPKIYKTKSITHTKLTVDHNIEKRPVQKHSIGNFTLILKLPKFMRDVSGI